MGVKDPKKPAEKLTAEEEHAMSDVLSFYGSEVTSHAGLTVGLAIAALTVLQVRFNLGSPSLFLRLILLFFVGLVITAGINSGLRIILYGTLSGVVMHSSVSSWKRDIGTHPDLSDWTNLTKVTMYSEIHLKADTLKSKRFRRFLLLERQRGVLFSIAVALLIVIFLGLLGF